MNEDVFPIENGDIFSNRYISLPGNPAVDLHSLKLT